MGFLETIAKAKTFLREHGRVSPRALQREFGLDDGALEDLVEELVDVQQVAAREGKALSWMGSAPARASGEDAGTAAAGSEPVATPDLAEAERRQLTVMFCDLVDSTDLSQRLDPEDLRNVMRAYQESASEVIERYEGHVAQYLGDGLLVYFGYPRAHEDDAERAVRAGREILTALGTLNARLEPEHGLRLAARVGIHTGPVVVGTMGGGAKSETLALGDTPNLAARLEGTAEPNSVVISGATLRLVPGLFVTTDLGTPPLKGISEPIRAYAVHQATGVRSRLDVDPSKLTPLVGRDQELGLLVERWEEAQEGEGQVVLVSGEPGIGKSRIVSALQDRLEALGAAALRFQCSPFHVNSAFYPSIDNLNRALRFDHSEATESRLDKLEALVVDHYRRPLADVRFLADLLSLPTAARYGAHDLRPEHHKQGTIRALVDLAEAAARQGPTMMVFEDAHWADPSTLDVLGLLVERVESWPLLVVLTYRPEFESRWSQHGHVTALDLSKLTRSQCRTIIAEITGGKALPEGLPQQIVERTDGVPLFVEELTRSILESGELTERPDRYEVSGAQTTVTIPATLRDSLMARIDRVPLVKAVAQIGAVVGREFTRELIVAVAPMEDAQLDKGLDRLVESGLAFTRGRGDDAVYTFKHAFVKDVAYDSLLKSRRKELHREIAAVIEQRLPRIRESEPELLAHHFTQAEMNEPAVAYWALAGEVAAKKSAHPEVIAHLEKGLGLLRKLPQSVQRDQKELDLRVAHATALITLKGYTASETEQAYAVAQELAERLGDVPQIFPIFYGRWSNQMVTGEINRSLQTAREIRRRTEISEDPLARLLGCRTLGTSSIMTGALEDGRAHLAEAMSFYDPERHATSALIYAQDAKVSVLAYQGLAQAYLGFPDRARQRVDEAMRWARQLGHQHSLTWTLLHAEWLEQLLGSVDGVKAHVDETSAINRRHGAPEFDDLASGFRGWVLLEQGSTELAVRELQAAIARWEETARCWQLTLVLTWLADGYGRLRRHAEGIAAVERSLNLIEQRGGEIHLSDAYRVYGALEASRGDEREAESLLERALATAASQGARLLELRAATSLARLWQRQGKQAEARDLLRPVYDWFTEGFDTQDLKDAKALLEELGA